MSPFWQTATCLIPFARFSLGTILLPLSPDVWLLHVSMMVAGAACILFMESTANLVRRVGGLVDDNQPDPDAEPLPSINPNEFLKSFYASFAHFLWNGPKHAPRTAMGKLALCALSFHTLVIAASYTASLAGFLATSSTLPIEVLCMRMCAVTLHPRFYVWSDMNVWNLLYELHTDKSARCSLSLSVTFPSSLPSLLP